MSSIVNYVLVGGIVLAAAAAINTIEVGARQQVDFIQISVLAQSQANYGIDENTMAIPAVSMEIIEDAVHDLQANSSLRVITYIALPAEEEILENQENEDMDPIEELEQLNGPGNENRNDDKDKDKDKEKDNNGNDQNKDKNKDKDNNGNDRDRVKDKNQKEEQDKSGNAQ